MRRPRPVYSGVLALTLAVGLVVLLVGLSVAASKLPGDTFQVTPRAVADSKVIIDSLGNGILDLAAGDNVHPLVLDLFTVASAPLMAVLAGVAPHRCDQRRPSPAGADEAGSRAPPL